MSAEKNVKTGPTLDEVRERAARRDAAKQARFNRDRARQLAHVQACIKSAGEAIAAGNVTAHDKWLDAANSAIVSYRQFVALTTTADAPSHADAAQMPA